MTERGDTCRFPDGKRVVFVELPRDNGGARLVLDWFVPPGAALVQTNHIHAGPQGAVVERFELISGSAECWIGGVKLSADAPHGFDVPAGSSHIHPRNICAGEMHVRQFVLPPEPDMPVMTGAQHFFETTTALAQQGKLNGKGEIADPLQSALTLNDTLIESTWLAGIPRPLQRVTFGAAAALARLLGYKALHAPRTEPRGRPGDAA